MHPEHRSIGELAYHIWQSRGCPEGSAEQDWLDAEKQLRSAQRADVPPANADAKWKAAEASRAADASRTSSAVRSRRSKPAQGKPSAEPPG